MTSVLIVGWIVERSPLKIEIESEMALIICTVYYNVTLNCHPAHVVVLLDDAQ